MELQLKLQLSSNSRLSLECKDFTHEFANCLLKVSTDRLEPVFESCSPGFVDAAHVNGAHFMVLPPFQSVDKSSGVTSMHHPSRHRHLRIEPNLRFKSCHESMCGNQLKEKAGVRRESTVLIRVRMSYLTNSTSQVRKPFMSLGTCMAESFP